MPLRLLRFDRQASHFQGTCEHIPHSATISSRILQSAERYARYANRYETLLQGSSNSKLAACEKYLAFAFAVAGFADSFAFWGDAEGFVGVLVSAWAVGFVSVVVVLAFGVFAGGDGF